MPDHPVWRAKHALDPESHPLWGIEHGCRTVVIYSPTDLSCYWNQSEHSPTNPAVINAVKVGQNIIDYATGREMPADKLTVREIRDLKDAAPKRGALRIAKLKHAGDWNIAPQAIPNLMDALRKPPHSFDVVITQKELFPRDPNLIYYPLLYIHGRGSISFPKEDLEALRQHLEPGGGTLFADAAVRQSRVRCDVPAFRRRAVPQQEAGADPARRRAVHDRRWPSTCPRFKFTKAAGGGSGLPSARGRQDQRPLGHHLFEERHRLRPGAARRKSSVRATLTRVP